jgi:transposase InsO family protein
MLTTVGETLAQGAGMDAICERLGVSARTIQRWSTPEGGEDRRCGPHTSPANKLTEAERKGLLAIANNEEFRDLSPKQIVPRLADQGTYVASESTFYRVLRAEKQLAHRGRAKAPTKRVQPELIACKPSQVWTWDITYLRTAIRGEFFYLYLVVDLYSRRIAGWEVHAQESQEHARQLMLVAHEAAGNPIGLRLHQDNGGPMKGSTFLATLQWLGVVPSFSRPRVSDDNPFSESLFRTLKYRPSYPEKPFATLEEARAWVTSFVRWYNTEHRHSAIRFVTPDERHFGREGEILEHRHAVYERARNRRPNRWSRSTRNWSPAGVVRLGPSPNASPAEEIVSTSR